MPYQKYFKGRQLSDNTIKLKTYNGSNITPSGKLQVGVDINSLIKMLFFCCKKGCRSLLGKDLLNILILDFSKLFDCKEID